MQRHTQTYPLAIGKDINYRGTSQIYFYTTLIHTHLSLSFQSWHPAVFQLFFFSWWDVQNTIQVWLQKTNRNYNHDVRHLFCILASSVAYPCCHEQQRLVRERGSAIGAGSNRCSTTIAFIPNKWSEKWSEMDRYAFTKVQQGSLLPEIMY